MAEARSKRTEHEISIREMSLMTKEKEFEDRLKRQEEIEARMINELEKEQQKKEQINIAEAESEKRDNELSLRESTLRAKEKELEDRLRRQEEIETQITNERYTTLKEKDRLNTVETEFEKREHELSLRELAVKTKEKEFEYKLNRRGEAGNIRSDNSFSDLIEKKGKLYTASADFDRRDQRLSVIETSMTTKEIEFEARLKHLENQERQRMDESKRESRISYEQMKPTSEKRDELISESISSQNNSELIAESKLKEDEFEARLNAMELAKVEMEKKINAESKDADKLDIATNAKEGLSRLTPQTDNRFSFPKFSRFSGDEPRPKSEATYEEWKYEVSCAQESELHSEQVMAQAIRKSLANQAKRVIVPMGTKVTVKEILDRLETVFGNVVTGDSILEEFHTATQKQDETVVAWGLRLEELMHKAISKGNVKREESDNLLKRRFWRKLKSEKLRNATRSKFESKMNFDQLRKAVREEEQETKPGVQHQPIQQRDGKNEDTSKSELLLKKLNSLEYQMKELSKKQTEMMKKQKEHDEKQKQQDDKQQQQGTRKQNPSQRTQNEQQSGN